jgi:ABC-2 type transport system permease protein
MTRPDESVHTDPGAIAELTDAARAEHAGATANGADEGYRARRTLRLHVELRRQLRRRRTQMLYGFLVLLPFLLAIAFEVGSSNPNRRSGGFVDLATASAPNFVVLTLFVSGTFLLPMIVALFFGDTIASEASWSSLKYLLAIPVPRPRLLAQKALASAVLSFAALVLLPLVAFLVGLVSYGAGEAVTPTGDAVDFPTALAAIGMSVVYIAIQLIWVAGLAMFLSVLIDAPLGAVGGAVLVSILSQILEQITALGSLRQYLPTHFAFSWSDLIATDIDWTNLAKGTMSSLIYGLVFGTLAFRRFMTKDITS